MRGALPEIERRGATLRVIGSGSPLQAGFFAEDHGLEGAVFTDPDRVIYRALRMRRGRSSTMNLAAAKGALRAFSAGFRQGRTQGDPLQQGGVLIVDGTGRIAFAHISETAGDHPTVDAMLGALDRLHAA